MNLKVPALLGLMAMVIGGSAGTAGAEVVKTPAQWAADFATMPTSGDGNESCAMDSGRRVFVTGDATAREGGPGPHSTMTVADSVGRLHAVRPAYPPTVAASPYQVVPEKEAGVMHWLGPCLYSAGKLYVLSPVVTMTGAGVRVDLLTFIVKPGADPKYQSAVRMPQPWVGSIWYDKFTGYAYWFGASQEATDGWTGRDTFVARTPVASLGLNRWQYWTGKSWGTGEPAPIMTAPRNGGTDLAYSAWRDSGGWHITSRFGGPWGTLNGVATVSRWTSPDLLHWTRADVATIDIGGYLVWQHIGLKVITYNVTGLPAFWIPA